MRELSKAQHMLSTETLEAKKEQRECSSPDQTAQFSSHD